MISDQNGSESRIGMMRRIDLPDFPVSWAGGIPAPRAPGYCFGSDDGRIQLTGLDSSEGLSRRAGPYPVAPSEEAINGIAFAGELLVASTRSEVVFLKVPNSGKDHGERAVFPGGAHGVLGTQGGRIVAPMGRRGILLLEPERESGMHLKSLKPADEALNLYRVASLASPDRGEVLACAGRGNGLTAISLAGDEKGPFRRLQPAGVDFVDVAALGVEGYPFAAAALGLGGSIHFSRDLLEDRTSLARRYHGIKGNAYRILCAEGHVFLLTSRALYTFVDLAMRFVEGQAFDGNSEVVGRLDLEAVDISLAYDRSLLVVMPETVYRITIDELIASANRRTGDSQEHSQNDPDAVIQPTDLGDETWVPFARPAWKVEELELVV